MIFQGHPAHRVIQDFVSGVALSERIPQELEERKAILDQPFKNSPHYEEWAGALQKAPSNQDKALLLQEAFAELDWEQNGRASISVDPRVADALILTDIPSDVLGHLRWPWTTFQVTGASHFEAIRVSSYTDRGGVQLWLTFLYQGTLFQYSSPLQVLTLGVDEGRHTVSKAVGRLVAGIALMAQQEPDRLKPRTLKSQKRRRRGRFSKVPLTKEYFLSAKGISLKVDLKQGVQDLLEGRSRKTADYKTQWVVRGHWRNQACGPGLLERRPKWIQPYWKGSETAPRLFKTYEAGA